MNGFLGGNTVRALMTQANDQWHFLANGIRVHRTALVGFQPIKSTSIARQPGEQVAPVIGANVTIGPYAIVYAGTEIGDDTFVGPLTQIREGVRIGKRCVVGFNVEIAYDTVIGDDVHIVGSAHITGKARIGNRVFIGQHSMMANEKHPGEYVWRGDEQGPTIGDDVTIGAGCYIQAGITIGDGATVAAMAVATKDVPPGVTVKGNPAR